MVSSVNEFISICLAICLIYCKIIGIGGDRGKKDPEGARFICIVACGCPVIRDSLFWVRIFNLTSAVTDVREAPYKNTMRRKK